MNDPIFINSPNDSYESNTVLGVWINENESIKWSVEYDQYGNTKVTGYEIIKRNLDE